jgi:hypothetical protein
MVDLVSSRLSSSAGSTTCGRTSTICWSGSSLPLRGLARQRAYAVSLHGLEAALGVEWLSGDFEQLRRIGQQAIGGGRIFFGSREVGPRLGDGSLPRRALPGRRRALGLGEPGASFVETPSLDARDRSRYRDHDLAEHAGERLVQPLHRLIDDRQRGIGVRGRGDERSVDALKEMASQRRPASERKRPPQQSLGRCPVTGGKLHFGQSLERMRRAGVGSHLDMQGNRLSEIGTGGIEVAGE